VINISDIITVFEIPSAYAFGDKFFETASIYSSKETYLAFGFAFSIILLLIIYFAFLPGKEKRYYFLWRWASSFFYIH
jgi:hypothetical protein